MNISSAVQQLGFCLYLFKSAFQMQFTRRKTSSQTDANQDKRIQPQQTKGGETNRRQLGQTKIPLALGCARRAHSHHSDCREINSFLHYIQMNFSRANSTETFLHLEEEWPVKPWMLNYNSSSICVHICLCPEHRCCFMCPFYFCLWKESWYSFLYLHTGSHRALETHISDSFFFSYISRSCTLAINANSNIIIGCKLLVFKV